MEHPWQHYLEPMEQLLYSELEAVRLEHYEQARELGTRVERIRKMAEQRKRRWERRVEQPYSSAKYFQELV